MRWRSATAKRQVEMCGQPGAMNVLKIWLLVTGGVIATGLMWAFVPILIPVFMIGGLLGLLVAGVIAAARWIEARRRPVVAASSDPERDMQPRQ